MNTLLTKTPSDIYVVTNSYIQEIHKYSRYASFDYCYRYFHPLSENKILDDMEKSCLTLGFYLASWGMFRGKSHLLSKSYMYYEPLINFIGESDKSIWTLDVDRYTPENIKKILEVYTEVRGHITQGLPISHLILTTKVMLGVFGIVPAYDRFFTDTFRDMFKQGENKCGFRSVNKKSLNCIATFYKSNQEAIDALSSRQEVLTPIDSKAIRLTYPKAKIIDMYGFASRYYNKA